MAILFYRHTIRCLLWCNWKRVALSFDSEYEPSGAHSSTDTEFGDSSRCALLSLGSSGGHFSIPTTLVRRSFSCFRSDGLFIARSQPRRSARKFRDYLFMLFCDCRSNDIYLCSFRGLGRHDERSADAQSRGGMEAGWHKHWLGYRRRINSLP